MKLQFSLNTIAQVVLFILYKESLRESVVIQEDIYWLLKVEMQWPLGMLISYMLDILNTVHCV